MSLTDESNPLPDIHPTGERRAELERIRDAVWPPNESAEDRQARIARNLAALDELRQMPKYHLTADDWKLIDQASFLDHGGES